MGKFLSKDEELQEFLEALPNHHHKFIFTNARYAHTRHGVCVLIQTTGPASLSS